MYIIILLLTSYPILAYYIYSKYIYKYYKIHENYDFPDINLVHYLPKHVKKNTLYIIDIKLNPVYNDICNDNFKEIEISCIYYSNTKYFYHMDNNNSYFQNNLYGKIELKSQYQKCGISIGSPWILITVKQL